MREFNTTMSHPGVDLIYHGSQDGHLEYDFCCCAGSGSLGHRLGIEYLRGEVVRRSSSWRDDAGQCPHRSKRRPGIARVDGTDLRFHKPVVYQDQAAASEVTGSKSEKSKP